MDDLLEAGSGCCGCISWVVGIIVIGFLFHIGWGLL